MPEGGSWFGSVIQFQRELDLTRRACGFADDPEAAAANDVRRQAKIYLVENVEELGAELQVCQFAISAAAERRILDEGHVELTEVRPAERIAAESSENALVGAGSARNIDGDLKEGAVCPSPAEIVFAHGAAG